MTLPVRNGLSKIGKKRHILLFSNQPISLKLGPCQSTQLLTKSSADNWQRIALCKLTNLL